MTLLHLPKTTKIVHTSWTDVIISKQVFWRSVLIGGMSRQVLSSSIGYPIGFTDNYIELNKCLQHRFISNYYYVIEEHQYSDSSGRVVHEFQQNTYEQQPLYETIRFNIITFQSKDDAALFKLSFVEDDNYEFE